MKQNFFQKESTRSKALRWSSFACVIAAVVLVFLTYIMNLPDTQRQYQEVQNWLTQMELYIAGFNKWIALLIVLAIFFMKAFVPFPPISILFITTGLIFPVPIAAIINIVGYSATVSVKYYWGKKHGGGNAHKLLVRSETIYKFMDLGGKGNKLMLLVLRFIPFVPLGTVSRIYGATEMEYWAYLVLSIIGFLPRLISWSVLGCNITNPFSVGFMAPIIVLLLISGVSLIILDTLLNLTKKQSERKLENEHRAD